MPYNERYTLSPHQRMAYDYTTAYHITIYHIVWISAAADQDRSCSLSSLIDAIEFV